MSLLAFLLRSSRGTVMMAVLTGLVAGGSSVGLIALIHTSFDAAGFRKSILVWGFVGLCLLLLASRLASEFLLVRLGQGAIFQLRMALTRQILAGPLRRLEAIGPSRLLVLLTEDVSAITEGLLAIPAISMNSAIVAGSLIYLGWLSPFLLIMVLGFMGAGILTYSLLERRALRALCQARDQADALYHHFRALTHGIKALKLHSDRRDAFYREMLEGTADLYRHHATVSRERYALADSWGILVLYLAIGLLLFAFPGWGGTQVMTGYTLTLLYLMSPLSGVLSALPGLGRARVALNRVEAFGRSLPEETTKTESIFRPESEGWGELKRLEMIGVTHRYHREGEEDPFTLGPIDLTFSSGELVFLIGGNGSGKTTLALLLVGLYLPERGEIRLNGRPISDENREEYRQIFSAVFSDVYLFDRLLGLERSDLDARAEEYLTQLQLHHKVQIKEKIFSTLDLSHGQRKRLALLTALLEDRPFYLFDEWAADQDPLFRDLFYTEILPKLKAAGKMILVITHDERYFHMADRCIRMDMGKVTQVFVPQEAAQTQKR